MAASIPREQLIKLFVKYAGIPPKEAALIGAEVDEQNIFDTEVALLASSPADGTMVFALDTQKAFLKTSAGFEEGAGPVDPNDPFTPSDGTFNIVGEISVRASGGAANSEQFGDNAAATGSGGTAAGANSSIDGTESTGLGEAATTIVSQSVAAGAKSIVTNFRGTTTGHGSSAAVDAVAAGRQTAAPPRSVVHGAFASGAGGTNSVLQGYLGAGQNSDRSVALGAEFDTNDFDDVILCGDHAAATKNGDGQWGSETSPADFVMRGADSANGETKASRSATVELTALSGASVAASALIPAGAVITHVTGRVTTTITGASAFDIGDGTDTDRWGAGIALTAGTEFDNRNWTDGAITAFPSGSDVVLTAITSDFTAGAVRITVHYELATAPTS